MAISRFNLKLEVLATIGLKIPIGLFMETVAQEALGEFFQPIFFVSYSYSNTCVYKPIFPCRPAESFESCIN